MTSSSFGRFAAAAFAAVLTAAAIASVPGPAAARPAFVGTGECSVIGVLAVGKAHSDGGRGGQSYRARVFNSGDETMYVDFETRFTSLTTGATFTYPSSNRYLPAGVESDVPLASFRDNSSYRVDDVVIKACRTA